MNRIDHRAKAARLVELAVSEIERQISDVADELKRDRMRAVQARLRDVVGEIRARSAR
nr:hypothetical protein [uncultured Bradyrhizobium sp.]